MFSFSICCWSSNSQHCWGWFLSKSLQISFYVLHWLSETVTFNDTVQSPPPSPNSTREQMTNNCWDCQVQLSVNPTELTYELMKRSQLSTPQMFSSHILLPYVPPSASVSSFCSFLCHIQADCIISEEVGWVLSVSVFFSIFAL